jgi:hypothetical protein
MDGKGLCNSMQPIPRPDRAAALSRDLANLEAYAEWMRNARLSDERLRRLEQITVRIRTLRTQLGLAHG